MPSDHHPKDARRVRRWIGAVVCLVALGIIAIVIPRLAPRSPLVIVLVCALAVLTMKLVERRVRQGFDRWERRQTVRSAPPKGRT
jgi:membrane protein implicated in regulation of membrane protease activity